MTRIRSPGYPSISLPQAIDITSKLHQHNRTNPIDREAAAKDIGYTGLTGQSAKILASLQHYGLVEKTGKGALKVSRTAVDIMMPVSQAGRKAALREAASAPELFHTLSSRFSDGVPSENALRSYLMRENFSSAAITPAVTSFLETYRFLQQEGAGESLDSTGDADLTSSSTGVLEGDDMIETQQPAGREVAQPPASRTIPQGQNERVVYVEEGGPGQYLKLVASGDVDDYLLEAIEDFVKRQRKRLARASKDESEPPQVN